jgi:hypothetical protein
MMVSAFAAGVSAEAVAEVEGRFGGCAVARAQ